ncbi:MAG: class I tRNA ligase family protein, partial [Bacteroidetes bacterium]|nr:class I tRNA ligase family protein [Bacteroidota bacterium]
QEFVDEHLSNWYVRLSRRRFWKGQYTSDKISAYQTLYTCLETIAQLASPIAPFFSEQLFIDLNKVTGRKTEESVHLTIFPVSNPELIDKDLEERMEMAQKFSSMVLSLRKKANIRVRQPLNSIMIPVTDEKMRRQLQGVENLILSEVNVKEINYLSDEAGVLIKKIKPNFKTLGPKFGKLMKQISLVLAGFSQFDIRQIEVKGSINLDIEGQNIELTQEDVEILTEDIPGWTVTAQDKLTVALDMTLTPELLQEGMARELVNRVQNLRKDSGLEVTDHILLEVDAAPDVVEAIISHEEYICSETLAKLEIKLMEDGSDVFDNELTESKTARIRVSKLK